MILIKLVSAYKCPDGNDCEEVSKLLMIQFSYNPGLGSIPFNQFQFKFLSIPFNQFKFLSIQFNQFKFNKFFQFKLQLISLNSIQILFYRSLSNANAWDNSNM